MSPRRLSNEALTLVANRFKILGEPLRLRLVQHLMEGERNVSDLVNATGANQANVSRHLATLTRAGILQRRKDGLNVFYAIADPSVLELCDLVCSSVERFYAEQAKVFH
jgi:ArsR family transcriptional regulator